MNLRRVLSALLLLSFTGPVRGEVNSVVSLREAIHRGSPGDAVHVAAGVYELTGPLRPKPKMVIRGAGIGKTILKPATTWQPGTDGLPKQENPDAYLFRFDGATGVTISDMTLTGPTLHGAVYCNNSDSLELHDLRIEDFLWSGIRTFRMDNFRVHDCVFVDAGGKQKHSGGAIYIHWTKDSDFWNNRISKTDEHAAGNFFGIKGRGAKRCRIHHNTIEVGFSIEFPFENDFDNEIDHNALASTISIPKFAGGVVIEEGHSFHIHHNWCRKSYAIEFARNAVEVDHNLFDFSVEDDAGNLISDFGRKKAPGPAQVHDNLIKNPGRGVFWSNGGYDQFHFFNNHVKASTPTRGIGLFGFPKNTDFSTIVIRDNIIECSDETPRPLMRSDASYAATIANNKLVNVIDTDRFDNPRTDDRRGPETPLEFRCGVNGEIEVEGWNARRTDSE